MRRADAPQWAKFEDVCPDAPFQRSNNIYNVLLDK